MSEPPSRQALFKYRRANGVTELKFRDENSARTTLAKEFLGFGNLIEGCSGGQASFDELKAHPPFSAFIEGDGKGMGTEFYVKAEGGHVTRRAVLVVCAPGKVRASCSWEAGDGITFETFSI